MLKYFSLSILFILLNGCNSANIPCSPEAKAEGHICYDGIDFGTNPNPLYKLGIKDGCSTGKGYFRKDYRYSKISKAYIDGWIEGRRVCRPPKTYSHKHSYKRVQKSSIVERAYPSTYHHSEKNSNSADKPEVITYQ